MQGVQLLVFPENGVFQGSVSRDEIRHLTEYIPDPSSGSNPCDDEIDKRNEYQIVRNISCLAKKHSMYIAADVGEKVDCKPEDKNCPKDKVYLYNTAIAFDNNGTLIAKYNKIQLFYELYYNLPQAKLSYFDTDFGRFGLSICFDMIFYQPGINMTHNLEQPINTLIYPTHWFDEAPFLGAAQNQRAWAVGNKVNVLAANIHGPKAGSVGSGIYSGDKGEYVYTTATDKEPKLLITNLPVDSRSGDSCESNSKVIAFPTTEAEKDTKVVENYGYQDMETKNTQSFIINNTSDNVKVCEGEFCCHLSYALKSEVSALNNQPFKFIVANRTRSVGYPWCEEFCVLTRYDEEMKNNHHFGVDSDVIFTEIFINASFSTEFVYPSAMGDGIELVPRKAFDYENNGKDFHLSISDYEKPIRTFGLYGRCYQRDPPYCQIPGTCNSSQELEANMFNLLFFILLGIASIVSAKFVF